MADYQLPFGFEREKEPEIYEIRVGGFKLLLPKWGYFYACEEVTFIQLLAELKARYDPIYDSIWKPCYVAMILNFRLPKDPNVQASLLDIFGDREDVWTYNSVASNRFPGGVPMISAIYEYLLGERSEWKKEDEVEVESDPDEKKPLTGVTGLQFTGDSGSTTPVILALPQIILDSSHAG